MIRVVSQIKQSKRFLDTLRSEVPWSVSLAVSGITLQLYATYMLLGSRNTLAVKLPFINYKIEDSNSS